MTFIIVYSVNEISAYGEIRSGKAIKSYVIGDAFEFIPRSLSYYNYRVTFVRTDIERFAFEVETDMKEISDQPLRKYSSSELLKFAKNGKNFPEIDTLFERTVFSKNDTFLSRVYKIFEWVNTNIKYELSSGDSPQDPGKVFAERKGNCDGYTELTRYLLRLSGIPAKKVFAYLYEKSAARGDYFHSMLALYHEKHGWILTEPQKMYLAATYDHIALIEEGEEPKTKIKYYDKDGTMEFTSKEDEESYLKNAFLDRFLSDARTAEKTVLKDGLNLKGIVNKASYKFISPPNDLFSETLLPMAAIPDSGEFNDFVLSETSTASLFPFQYEHAGETVQYSDPSGDSEEFFIYGNPDGGKYIIGLEPGSYYVFYLRSGLPLRLCRISVSASGISSEPVEVKYLLQQGVFESIEINIPDAGVIGIDKKNKGFAAISELQLDPALPLYMEFADDFFYIYGIGSEVKCGFKFIYKDSRKKPVEVEL